MNVTSALDELLDQARRTPPRVALILGSGLGPAADRMENTVAVPFSAWADCGVPTVPGHLGAIKLGQWGETTVLVLQGRLHYYEGFSWQQVVRPVELAGRLGVRFLLATNAVGGIHDALGPGRLMIARDHFEWLCPFGWREPGPGGIGPVRASPYSTRLRSLLRHAGERAGIDLFEGIYAAVTGPNYETAAEVRALRACGADAVGMSTTREIAAAQSLGLECAAISCVANRAAGLSSAAIHHDDVLATAAKSCTSLRALLDSFLMNASRLPSLDTIAGRG